MPNWSGSLLTSKGQALQAKVDAGQTTLTLTKMKIGSGVISGGQNLQNLNDLVAPEMIVPISGVTANGNITTITGVITNTGIENGFNVRELGLFAQDPTLGEILYSITTDSAPDYLPPEGGAVTVSEEFSINIVVSNTANITAAINPNGLVTASILESKVTDHNADEDAHAAAIGQHNASGNAHAGLLRLWQPNKNYVVGDTYRPLSLSYPSWMFLECIQAGVSGPSEPAWGAAGDEITDGTVRWRVRDIKSGGGVGIGTVLPFLATQAQPGWLALDTGAEVSRATYPQLWEWVQENAPLITESTWQAQAAVQSSVGAYSSGDGSTTFRLPRIVDFVRGSDGVRASGTFQEDEFKSHTHNAIVTTIQTNATTSNNLVLGRAYGETTATGGDETRPKSISMLYCVKAFDAPTNQGLVDITELANELAGKVSKTETGYRVRKWASGEYTPVLNTPCIVNHGLDIDPENCLCDVRLKCVVAEGGYSVGDFAIGWYITASVSTQGTTHAPVPKLTASEIQFNTGDYTSSTTNGIGMLNKNSGAYVKATLANWRYVFRIFY